MEQTNEKLIESHGRASTLLGRASLGLRSERMKVTRAKEPTARCQTCFCGPGGFGVDADAGFALPVGLGAVVAGAAVEALDALADLLDCAAEPARPLGPSWH